MNIKVVGFAGSCVTYRLNSLIKSFIKSHSKQKLVILNEMFDHKNIKSESNYLHLFI